MRPIHIRVFDGDAEVFQGRQFHWVNCFVTDGDLMSILDFCHGNNWNRVVIRDLNAKEILSLDLVEKEFLRDIGYL